MGTIHEAYLQMKEEKLEYMSEIGQTSLPIYIKPNFRDLIE
jgi:hypothetical protein